MITNLRINTCIENELVVREIINRWRVDSTLPNFRTLAELIFKTLTKTKCGKIIPDAALLLPSIARTYFKRQFSSICLNGSVLTTESLSE